MMGAPIQSALSYVIVISNLGLNWDKMDALVWVRAHNYLYSMSLAFNSKLTVSRLIIGAFLSISTPLVQILMSV